MENQINKLLDQFKESLLAFVALKKHPVYTNYACNPDKGYIMNLKTNKELYGNTSNSGYNLVGVSGPNVNKTVLTHRFIWECVNGLLKPDEEIDHIDNIKTNNKISNLRVVTRLVNVRKGLKNRDSNYAKNIAKMRKSIIVMDENNEIKVYQSIYRASAETNINPGLISMILRNPNHKSAKSKTDDKVYYFQYSNRDVKG